MEEIPPSSTNETLTKYLTRYCSSPVSPGYAVMLSGPWGSGKTWFIRDFREKLKELSDQRSLYVSLYGVGSIEEIANQFFQQLHPYLSKPAVQKTWSIIKSVVKTTVKVDLGEHSRELDLQLSPLELNDLASPDGAVLIFDDFERAAMPPMEVLGYINQFVEHDGYRVVILANEEKIIEKEQQFISVKEKVVGRTFRIQPQTKEALNSFLDELLADDAIEVLKARKSKILEVEANAKYDNYSGPRV